MSDDETTPDELPVPPLPRPSDLHREAMRLERERLDEMLASQPTGVPE